MSLTLDIASLGSSVFGPSNPSQYSQQDNHFVQLYADEHALVDAVRTFISVGLSAGDAAIVVADQAHREAFEGALTASGVDVQAARDQGLYVSLDADSTLAGFMVDGMPDRAKFEGLLGGLIEGAAEGGRNVRVFGEMVTLLWAQGNVAAAVSLEELWNGLAETHPFRLFCAYPADAFGRDTLEPLRRICNQHSTVIPPAR